MGKEEIKEIVLISNLIISMVNITSIISIALNMKVPIRINTFKMGDIPLSSTFLFRGWEWKSSIHTK